MRAFSTILILLAASIAPALEAQTTPRRPPADTLRFGATRPAAGDSISMAEYDADDADDADASPFAGEDPAGIASDDPDVDAGAGDDEEDAVRPKPRTGPYARAAGTGPFSVESSGQTAPRPAGGEVVWLGGRAARPDAARDTAAGQRVASGASARRDTASASASTATARRDTAAAGRTRPATTTGGRPSSTPTTPASSGSGSARARTHTVAAGETFYGIARRYGVTAAQLRAINPDVEMNTLEVGDVLRLPASARDSRASGAASATQPAPRTGSRPASGAARTHAVVAGETLFGIARRYGVTVDAIRAANDMETDQVRTGQRLVIPPAR